jgi:hypothetical protein
MSMLSWRGLLAEHCILYVSIRRVQHKRLHRLGLWSVFDVIRFAVAVVSQRTAASLRCVFLKGCFETEDPGGCAK